MSERRVDVVVVGAGSAGAAAAWHLARRGARVMLLDHRPPASAGARWINGVPPWMFDEAGLPPPCPPERRPVDGAFIVCGPSGPERVRLDPNPVWAVDMRLLIERLQGLATAAGAQLYAPGRLLALHEDVNGRPVRATIDAGAEPFTVAARLFVDATGLSGALRRRVHLLQRDCPEIPPEHICSAAQAVYAIDDPAAARQAFAARGMAPGDVWSTVGLDGGYSTANLALSPDLEEVELLAGALALPDRRSGNQILRALAQAHPWIGERRFGGAGAIPLRRPFDRLSAPGVALLGNAASQVFSAHGSGIGIGLVAARQLADAALAGHDPGGTATTWAYQAAFHRRWGGLLAAYDLFRRATQSLTGDEVDRLMAAGVLGPSNSRAALEQRLVLPSAREVPRLLSGLLEAPRLSRRVARRLTPLPRIVAHYARYPLRPDRRALVRWSAKVAALFDEAPDLR